MDEIVVFYREGDIVEPPCNWHIKHLCKKCKSAMITSFSSRRTRDVMVLLYLRKPQTCRYCKNPPK